MEINIEQKVDEQAPSNARKKGILQTFIPLI